MMTAGSLARFARRGTNFLKRRLLAENSAPPVMPISSVPVSPAPAAPPRDVNQMLHDLRSAQLRKMPKVSGTLLSAGCSGAWYFDWIREQTGHVGRHIGLEFYSPKPDVLPDNVEWIVNTVGDMSAVADGSCQLVFSGQNIEHLWAEDVVGFLEESARVLEPGGWLVVDSPNRLVTAALTWSHPEHMVELTPAEAVMLAEFAGFEVVDVAGLWLCRDPVSGRTLPFEPDTVEADWPMVERIAAAERDPDNSFIWWLTARKTGVPQPERLVAEMDRIFAAAWAERKTRFLSQIGTKTASATGTVIRCEKDQSGAMVYGPYMPLPAGSHSVEFTLEATGGADPHAPAVRCDVIGASGQEIAVVVLSSAEVGERGGVVRFDFDLVTLEFGIQARCFSLGTAAIECALPVTIN